MKMTFKHNFYPFCNSRYNALQRFQMPCVIDPLKALLHWDVIVLMDRWAYDVVIQFSCSQMLTSIYMHTWIQRHNRHWALRPSSSAPDCSSYNQSRNCHVCFISSIAFGCLSYSCVFDPFTWRESAGVCVCVFGRLYTTWLNNFSSDFWSLYFQQSFIHHLIKYIRYYKCSCLCQDSSFSHNSCCLAWNTVCDTVWHLTDNKSAINPPII